MRWHLRFIWVLFTVLIFIWALLMLLIFWPFYKLIQLMCFLTVPETIEFPGTEDNHFILDDLSKPLITLVSYSLFNKPTDIREFRRLFQKRLLDVKVEDKYIFDNFKKFAKKYYGYSVMALDKTFDLQNHVRVYDYQEKPLDLPKPCVQSDLQRVFGPLVGKAWAPNRSPWEMLMVYGYKDATGEDKMMLIFRIHHSIADGTTFRSIRTHLFQHKDSFGSILPPGYGKVSWGLRVGMTLKMIWDFGEYASWNWGADRTWSTHGNPSHHHVVGFFHIPVSEVKRIKDAVGLSYLSVLTSAVLGGLHQYMEERAERIPSNLLAFIPMPKFPLHGGMGNHSSGFVILCPVLPMKCWSELKQIHDIVAAGKTSLAGEGMVAFTRLWKFAPDVVRDWVFRHFGSTATLSTAPVQTAVRLKDSTSCWAVHSLGLVTHFSGMSICMAGENNIQGISVAIDQHKFPVEANVERIIELVQHKLHSFASLIKISPTKFK